MRYCIFLIVYSIGVRCGLCFWPPAYKVDLRDRKVFVISSEEGDYDEENEDEMIRAEDLAEFEPLSKGEDKFRALHEHVESYNKMAARTATEFADVFPNFYEPNLEEIRNLVEEAKPFVAGFKQELDEYDFEDLEERVFKAVRKKRNATEEFTDLGINSTTQMVEMKVSTGSEEGQIGDEGSEEPEEETKTGEAEKTNDEESLKDEEYDYEQFKAEYYGEIERMKNDNKTFNYTDNGEPEETAEDAIKKIVDFKMPKNCTREELTQFGAKALECLAYDYKNAKDKKSVRKILSRTWLVIRIWVFVYLFIAIPCWCQKGWCCCCLNCAFCNPGDTIETAKKYYADNPPGILTEEDENGESKVTEFEPTLFELKAFEKFESAIRNL